MKALDIIRSVHSATTVPSVYCNSLADFLEAKTSRQTAILHRLVNLISCDGESNYQRFVRECGATAANYYLSDSSGKVYSLIDLEDAIYPSELRRIWFDSKLRPEYFCTLCGSPMHPADRRYISIKNMKDPASAVCPSCGDGETKTNTWEASYYSSTSKALSNGVLINANFNIHEVVGQWCPVCHWRNTETHIQRYDNCPKCRSALDHTDMGVDWLEYVKEDIANGDLYTLNGRYFPIGDILAHQSTINKQNRSIIATLRAIANSSSSDGQSNQSIRPGDIMATINADVGEVKPADFPELSSILQMVSNPNISLDSKVTEIVSIISDSVPTGLTQDSTSSVTLTHTKSTGFTISRPDTSDMNGYVGLEALIDDATNIADAGRAVMKAAWKSAKNFCDTWLMPKVEGLLATAADKLEIKPFNYSSQPSNTFELAVREGQIEPIGGVNRMPSITLDGGKYATCLPEFAAPELFGFSSPIEFAWAAVRKVPVNSAYRIPLKFGDVYVFRDRGDEMFENGPRYLSDGGISDAIVDDIEYDSDGYCAGCTCQSLEITKHDRASVISSRSSSGLVYTEPAIRRVSAVQLQFMNRLGGVLNSHKSISDSTWVDYNINCSGRVGLSNYPLFARTYQVNFPWNPGSYLITVKFVPVSESTFSLGDIYNTDTSAGLIININYPASKSNFTYQVHASFQNGHVALVILCDDVVIVNGSHTYSDPSRSDLYRNWCAALLANYADESPKRTLHIRRGFYATAANQQGYVSGMIDSVSANCDHCNYMINIDGTAWGEIPELHFPQVHYVIKLAPVIAQPLYTQYKVTSYDGQYTLIDKVGSQLKDSGYITGGANFRKACIDTGNVLGIGGQFQSPASDAFPLSSTRAQCLLPSYDMLVKSQIQQIGDADPASVYKGLRTADSLMNEFFNFVALKALYVSPTMLSGSSADISAGAADLGHEELLAYLSPIASVDDSSCDIGSFLTSHNHSYMGDSPTNLDFVNLLNGKSALQPQQYSRINLAIYQIIRDLYCSSSTALSHIQSVEESLDVLFFPYEEVSKATESSFVLRTDTQNSGKALILAAGITVGAVLAYFGLAKAVKLLTTRKLKSAIKAIDSRTASQRRDLGDDLNVLNEYKKRYRKLNDVDKAAYKDLKKEYDAINRSISRSEAFSGFLGRVNDLLNLSPTSALVFGAGATVVSTGVKITEAIKGNRDSEDRILEDMLTRDDASDIVRVNDLISTPVTISDDSVALLAREVDNAVTDDFNLVNSSSTENLELTTSAISVIAGAISALGDKIDTNSSQGSQFPGC